MTQTEVEHATMSYVFNFTEEIMFLYDTEHNFKCKGLTDAINVVP